MCMAMAIALCISLSACGNTDDVTGDDRRASGDVAGSGTITHDGAKSLSCFLAFVSILFSC